MAEESGDGPEPKKKGAPPNVRIRTSDEGTRVARVVAPLESRPSRTRDEEPIVPPPEPPLAQGTDLGTSSPAPEPAPQKRAKPPPPHAGRTPPPRRVREPPEIRERPVTPTSAVKVRVAEAAKEPPAVPPEAPAEESAAAAMALASQHPHEGAHPHISTDEGRLSALSAALFVVVLVFLAELYAGFLSNSLALFSDAGHVFMDLFSYWLAFAAVRMSQRKSSARETFGAHRAEIVSAFVSGLVLLLVVGVIYFEAGQRLYRISRGQALDLDYSFMVSVPWLSVVANWYLLRRFHGAHDINIRGAHLHVWSDFISALGVIIAGVLILATGNVIFDPLVSIFIGFLILIGALELIRDSLNVLLERTPAHIDVNEIVERVRGVPGVSGVHSVHVWSLCSTVHAMSAHVVAAPEAVGDTQRLLEATRERIAKDYSIDYTTFQVECQDCGAGDYQTAAHAAPAPKGQAPI